MRTSKLMEDLRREQRERFARMTPEQLLAMSEQLGDEGLADYMSAHGVDRPTALQVFRRSRRAGRKPSVCMDSRNDP
jgi:hypothetical protein